MPELTVVAIALPFAAASTALTMFWYPVQRQRLPRARGAPPARWDAVLLEQVAALMIMPGVQ